MFAWHRNIVGGGGFGKGNNLSVLEMIRLSAKAFDFGSWILGDSFSSTPY